MDRSPPDVVMAEEFVRSLLRAVRSYRSLGATAEASAEQVDQLWRDTIALLADGAVELPLAPFGLLVDKPPRAVPDTQDALWFALFRDGVRSVSLEPGVEPQELAVLLEVISSQPPRGEDHVTLAWRRELPHIGLRAVDVLDVDGIIEADGVTSGSEDVALGVLFVGAPQPQDGQLPEGDMRGLLGERRLSWMRDAEAPDFVLQAGSLAGLVDSDERVAHEIVEFFELATTAARDVGDDQALARTYRVMANLVVGLLRGRDAAGVARVLRLLAEDDTAPARRVLSFFVGVDADGDERAVQHSRRDLARLIDHHSAAFGPAIDALAERHPALLQQLLLRLRGVTSRGRVASALGGGDQALVDLYKVGLMSDDEGAALEAIGALATLDSEPSTAALVDALRSPHTEVRRRVMLAICGRYQPDMLLPVGRALVDPARPVRIAALDVVRDSGAPMMRGPLLAAMRAPDFLSRDRDERQAFVLALARYPSAQTWDYLGQILSERNLARDSALGEQQLMAVEALSQMEADEALELGREALGRWYLPRAVRDGLRAWLEGSRS